MKYINKHTLTELGLALTLIMSIINCAISEQLPEVPIHNV